jgi:two-component system, NarL family, response regulator NreC
MQEQFLIRRPKTMAMKILLVDDHEIMREGICALLRKHPEMDVVGQAADGRMAIDMVRELQPDVVVMDIGMPNLNGIEATRQMIIENPHLKVMALSTHSDGSVVAKMIKAGATGYMLKESAFSELLDGLHTMAEGKTYLCSKISKVVFADYVNLLTNPKSELIDGLTIREREILQLVAEGHTTKDIARELHLSPKTVDSHREHIMEKLGVRNVACLTKYAIREGLTTL